ALSGLAFLFLPAAPALGQYAPGSNLSPYAAQPGVYPGGMPAHGTLPQPYCPPGPHPAPAVTPPAAPPGKPKEQPPAQPQQPQAPQAPETAQPAAPEPSLEGERGGAAGGETAALAAPNMIGDLLMGTRSVRFSVLVAGSSNVATPGSTSITNPSVAE